MDIRVAIEGQYLGQSGLIASFQSSQDNKWVTRLFHAREHGRSLLKDDSTKECFVIWYDEVNGWNYGVILHSPTDTRDGYVMIVVCTGNCIIDSGESVINMLHDLTQLFLSNQFQTIQDLQERCKDKVASIVSTVRLSLIQPMYSDSNKKGNAFRIVRSKEDLLNIFQYPNQKEYGRYERVFLVSSADIVELAKAGYVEIKEPVRKVYNVILPVNGNVSSNKHTVYFGDTIEISYHKQYCQDYTCIPTIDGVDNKILHYQGNSIVISDEVSAGVRFSRFISLRISSDNGTTIKDAKWSQLPSIPVQQDKLRNGFLFSDGIERYAIHLSAKGYEATDVFFSDEDFNIGMKQVYMKAKRMDFSIEMKTDDGVVRGRVYINADDPLYDYLKDASSYNQPLIYKGYSRYPKPKGPKNKWSKVIKKVLMGLSGLLFIWILYAVLCFVIADSSPWPFTSKSTEAITDTLSNNYDDAILQDTVGASRDIVFMKHNDTWDKTQLQSQKYQTLCDYITKGQVDDIVSQQWFEEGVSVNSFWQNHKDNGIYNILNKIINDPTKKDEASQILRDNSTDGKIKLSSLNKQLQDLTKPVEFDDGLGNIPETRPEQKPKASPKKDKPKAKPVKKEQKNSQSGEKTIENGDGRPSSH